MVEHCFLVFRMLSEIGCRSAGEDGQKQSQNVRMGLGTGPARGHVGVLSVDSGDKLFVDLLPVDDAKEPGNAIKETLDERRRAGKRWEFGFNETLRLLRRDIVLVEREVVAEEGERLWETG